MMDCSTLSVGDKAMLVGTHGFGRRLYVEPVKVAKVHKTGQILLVGKPQRYRQDGSATGRSYGYTSPPKLQPCSDEIWQRYQVEKSQAALASNLFELGELLKLKSRDPQVGAEIWEALPFEIRQILVISKETE